jgi:hypothetical protein
VLRGDVSVLVVVYQAAASNTDATMRNGRCAMLRLFGNAGRAARTNSSCRSSIVARKGSPYPATFML